MDKLIKKLEKKSFLIRKMVLDMCIAAETGHLTSSMSCIDLLVSLYHGNIMRYDAKNPNWNERDWFILSKGQASPALYAVLADCGFFDRKDLNKFAQKDGKIGVHLQNDVPGVEITSGSLGHGFGIAAGIALGFKQSCMHNLVFTLLGDGECYEGSIWETAMFATHNKLNNLVAIIDRNYLCATDFTENIVGLEPLDDKWKSFGWDVVRLNGHDFIPLLNTLESTRARRKSVPMLIIADTTKGEGIECISNIPLWHGIAPKGKDAEVCRVDLNRRYNYE